MTLGANEVKRIRERLKLTQGQLANALGVSRESVARWENGARRIAEPTARLLVRLAKNHWKETKKRK